MVLVGQPQPAAADHRGGTHDQTSLDRYPPLVPQQDRQRHHGSRQRLAQAAKAKARGYRFTRNLKAIIYLITGKLKLALPT